MGFLDALKSVANMVTGGGATVSLEIGPRSPDGSYPAKIKAEIADADLKIERVYLKVEGHESVTVKIKKEGQTNLHEETFTEKTYTGEIDAAPGQTLAKKTVGTWVAVIRIPPDSQPTYTGKNAKHEWRAYAALDVTGTDPASSWISFNV